MKTQYKDYTIVVSPIDSIYYGGGFSAVFYVAKDNGLKAQIQEYIIYDEAIPRKKFIEKVRRVIDSL